jgi:hypothetical protein
VTGAVYHWWGSSTDAPPYANLRAPILLSIATLRAVSDVPILVLDGTRENGHPVENDWAHFPQKLKFNVQRIDFEYARHKDKVPGYRHLSRVEDIARTCVMSDWRTLMYVDSDVFFFRDPLPLHGDPAKFCFNGSNSGFFYHDFRDPEFFEVFTSYTRAAIHSPDVRRVMRQYVGYDGWYGVWDEMILTYMKNHHPRLFAAIPFEEHTTVRALDESDAGTAKVFHANGLMVANDCPKNAGEKEHCRGLLGLIVREFYDNIVKVLDEADLKLVYTDAERRLYLPQQFNLLGEDLRRLKATQTADGHYHTRRLMKSPRIMI